jgi:hypothetical protein
MIVDGEMKMGSCKANHKAFKIKSIEQALRRLTWQFSPLYIKIFLTCSMTGKE